MDANGPSLLRQHHRGAQPADASAGDFRMAFHDHLDSPLEARMPRLPWRRTSSSTPVSTRASCNWSNPWTNKFSIQSRLSWISDIPLSRNCRAISAAVRVPSLSSKIRAVILSTTERGPPLITGAAEGNDIARGLRGKRGKFRGGFDPHELRDVVVELDDPELRIPDGHERGETAFLHRPLANA